jgi:hypothetical protein
VNDSHLQNILLASVASNTMAACRNQRALLAV